jgi:ATP-dependent Zn protease
VYGFTSETVDLAAIRERIASMSDEALERYGRAAAFMAGRSYRETWRVQLEEARAGGAVGSRAHQRALG